SVITTSAVVTRFIPGILERARIFKPSFSMTGAISQDRERCQFLFCFLKNPCCSAATWEETAARYALGDLLDVQDDPSRVVSVEHFELHIVEVTDEKAVCGRRHRRAVHNHPRLLFVDRADQREPLRVVQTLAV